VTRSGNVSPIWLHLDALCDFFEDEVAQKKWQHFGLLLFVYILYIFTKIWSDVDVLDIPIELWCRYFGLFGLTIVLATFGKIGPFFPIFLSP